LQEDPGVSAVQGPLGQRPGDHYRLAHASGGYRGLVRAPAIIVSGMIAATHWQGGATWAAFQ
jgi:hypothetical protein